MMYLGQVVQNVKTGAYAVYAGFDNSEEAMFSGEDEGFCYFTPDIVWASPDDYEPVKDDNGKIIIGDFVKWSGGLGFWGCIDYDKLPDEGRDVVRKVCAGNIGNLRGSGRISCDVC